MRISKPGTLIDYERLSAIRSPHRPTNIHFQEDVLSMDFIDGHPPKYWHEIEAAALHSMWEGGSGAYYDVDKYLHYIQPLADWRAYDFIAHVLHRSTFTPVRFCHGDFTLSNMIQCFHTGNIFFIDPGNPRGLSCRELDEAKLLQSLEGWEHLARGRPTFMWPRFEVKPVHLALLCSHYIRLQRYNHSSAALEFAQQRIKELWSCSSI